MILLFILFSAQVEVAPLFEIHGRLGIEYTRQETEVDSLYITHFWLHYGIIDLTFHPHDKLKILYSNDLGVVRRFYAIFSYPHLKGNGDTPSPLKTLLPRNVNIGKFSIPFGQQIIDHTSLLEDNIGLGLNRDKTGIAGNYSYRRFNLSAGIFPIGETKLYTTTADMKLWAFDIGMGYLLEETEYKQVNREYYEYYNKLFIPFRISLLAKCIYGRRLNTHLLGYAILGELPIFPLISPFAEYEGLKNSDLLSRIGVGVNSIIMQGAMIRVGYYLYSEKQEEVKNNILSLMLIVEW
ncbi:MAG: hypothetical protein HY769_02795 [Candidatus Stahlbacteria bacterium]|nr:hypothetical protein [Candidatus Stahlbacteria bacterium]